MSGSDSKEITYGKEYDILSIYLETLFLHFTTVLGKQGLQDGVNGIWDMNEIIFSIILIKIKMLKVLASYKQKRQRSKGSVNLPQGSVNLVALCKVY